MAGKVLIMDTSILCVWLQVPNMDTVAKKGEKAITHEVVEAKIEAESKDGTRIVLPIASIIECGNHIAQIKGRDRHPYVRNFADMITDAIEGNKPWDIFSNQSSMFDKDVLKALVEDWRDLGVKGISLGDASIKQVAEFYHSKGFETEIYTGDAGLKSYEPPKPVTNFARNRNRR